MGARTALLAVSAVAGALLLTGCVPQELPRSFSAPASDSPVALAAPAVSPAAAGNSAGAGTATTVTRVIDGDTFVVTGGTKVRVLGIDSCEAGTPGGTRATRAAEDAILGQAVRLTAEPGVDRDRYGRQLRYVSYTGGDLAEMMVRADHTAIYTGGRNDASAAVQARLRGLDADGRTCGTTTTTTDTGTTNTGTPGTTRPAPAAAGTPKPKPAPRPAAVAAAPRPRPAASSSGMGYANCTAARAAGVTPLHRGQAGYSAKLDRDGDGVACE
ncbi:thermonuclease family protein [Actinomycetospora atypica]|uniref:Thermonuclease family protein n=1 Tax=Actinomycetospora atypica TaxID=1290095 RepID=A0ABV9YP08_9PSEU